MKNSVEYFPALFLKKAVTLVVHGLNVKPLAMLAIVELLTFQASDVYLVKLSGHHSNSMHMEAVTSLVWQREIIHGYTVAKAASIKNSIPLFFVGYSLGALLGLAEMVNTKSNITFDKQVLFAPAIAVRTRAHLLKLIIWISGIIKIGSRTPAGYRANNTLPVSVYKILFNNKMLTSKPDVAKLNIPSLIFIDPKDELISYRKLINYVKEFQLTNYQIVTIKIDLKSPGAKYHHLIIDEPSMGQKSWQILQAKMIEFLF